jgi:hypothetical protein
VPRERKENKILNTDERKIHMFLTNNGAVTARELSAGSEVPLDRATAILSVLVSAGDVVQTGSMNTATYALAGYTPPAPPAPVTDTRSTEQIWSDESRRRGLEEYTRLHPAPKPEPREPIPALDEIILPPAPKPLSKEEREFLEVSTKNRRGAMPQAFIVR